jgi:hypothetical protein
MNVVISQLISYVNQHNTLAIKARGHQADIILMIQVIAQ